MTEDFFFEHTGKRLTPVSVDQLAVASPAKWAERHPYLLMYDDAAGWVVLAPTEWANSPSERAGVATNSSGPVRVMYRSQARAEVLKLASIWGKGEASATESLPVHGWSGMRFRQPGLDLRAFALSLGRPLGARDRRLSDRY
jgi:hypothetical protein